MKVGSKQRRTKQEILENQKEEQLRLQAVEGKMEQWHALQKDLKDAKLAAQ